MSEDQRPVDMGRCGPWNQAGIERWQTVARSWGVFQRNTVELLEFLKTPTRNPAVFPALVSGNPLESAPFWEEFDQRLHNQLAAAVSLIDHTRPLMRYYEDDAPDLVAGFTSRNERVRGMECTAFLRDLRNYLMHRGVAPRIFQLSFGGPDALPSGGVAFAVKLDAARLLEWKKWTAGARGYLSKFEERDGPVVLNDVVAYAGAMQDMYRWLFQQRQWVVALMPDRFRIGDGPPEPPGQNAKTATGHPPPRRPIPAATPAEPEPRRRSGQF